MDDRAIPQFGARLPGKRYLDRPSVYGLAFDDRARLLVVRVPSKEQLVLPGGGVDSGEEPVAALHREIHEETGFAVRVAGLLGRANEFIVTKKKGKAHNKLGTFYLVALKAKLGPPLEADHEVHWLTHAEAGRTLSWESHRWALARALLSA